MCGIWCVINQEVAPFDYQSFCTLGAANDRRGGDSCGVFIDGKVEYGIDKKARFEDFFWDSELLNNTATARFALGHDRKASVGMPVNLKNAHPIIITEPIQNDDNSKPEEEIKFVMVHNGTIYNYKTLAKKYIPDVDITDMTDSQVLARLIYYSGFDFLAEYNGGTAFIAIDYRTEDPTVLIWKGASKEYSSSGKIEDERPLFCNITNGRLVMSSIPSYLAIVDDNCYTVPENVVITYQNGKLIKLKEIDRSKAQQREIYVASTYNYSSTYKYSTTKYLRGELLHNLYYTEDTLLDGQVKFTSFGRIIGKYDSYTTTDDVHSVYFFAGIPICSRRSAIFLLKALKVSKMKVADFVKTYQNFIRYFSLDQLYFDKGLLYKATTPWERALYSGRYQLLTHAYAHIYKDGIDTYGDSSTLKNPAFDRLEKNIDNLDYKTIWKEFIQSME